MSYQGRDRRREGQVAELEFERKLVDLGYGPIMRPARQDDGVDFVVWTAKGWMGVQVKKRQQKPGGRRQRRGDGSSRGGAEKPYAQFSLRGTPMLVDGRWVRRKNGKTHYASRGVSVFAVYTGQGFYLVPIANITGEGDCRLASLGWTWEAWGPVMGEPAPAIAAPATDPLEQMALLPEKRP